MGGFVKIKWFEFTMYNINILLFCVLKNIFWKTTFTGVLYHLKGNI